MNRSHHRLRKKDLPKFWELAEEAIEDACPEADVIEIEVEISTAKEMVEVESNQTSGLHWLVASLFAVILVSMFWEETVGRAVLTVLLTIISLVILGVVWVLTDILVAPSLRQIRRKFRSLEK